MKTKMKKKYRSPRYDKNRPRSRHGWKCSKYKKCLSMMIRICTKQHLNNIWISTHEKDMHYWSWVEKSVAYKKAGNMVRTSSKGTFSQLWPKCLLCGTILRRPIFKNNK